MWLGSIRCGTKRDDLWNALRSQWKWEGILEVTVVPKHPRPKDWIGFVDFQTAEQAESA